ncbi:hypothetical protein G6514_003939 [Epicoccum nigrum]|nr:hypothetical protein G6514_003939 [Epicoccum nigrum]
MSHQLSGHDGVSRRAEGSLVNSRKRSWQGRGDIRNYTSHSDDVEPTAASLANSRQRPSQERELVPDLGTDELQNGNVNINPLTTKMELVNCRPSVSATSTKQRAKYRRDSQLALRSSAVKRAATMGNNLAKTVIDIVAHYEKVATDVNSLVDDVVLLVGGSKSELKLNHVLQMFYDGSADNEQDAMFSEELMSVLLAHERPGADSYALAPFESSAAWLAYDKDLDNRISCISADIIRILNGKAPSCDSYPFQDIGSAGSTRHLLFCYKPSRSWVTVETSYDDCLNSVRLGKIDLIITSNPDVDHIARGTCVMAREELVPLLTLAQYYSKSPLSSTQWSEERTTMICQFQSGSGLHSGPLSILTAVYKSNGEPLPSKSLSTSEEMSLAWRIRLACARRLLYLLRGELGTDMSKISLYDLLKKHVASIVSAKPSAHRSSAQFLYSNIAPLKQTVTQPMEVVVEDLDSNKDYVAHSTSGNDVTNETSSGFEGRLSATAQLPSTLSRSRVQALHARSEFEEPLHLPVQLDDLSAKEFQSLKRRKPVIQSDTTDGDINESPDEPISKTKDDNENLDSDKATAIRPFAREELYPCPYFATGQKCDSKQRLYTYKGLTRHVLLMHHNKGDGPATSFDTSPFEDGSFKIPCRNGCPTLFTSYQQSVQHAKKTSTCSWTRPTTYMCPWTPYNGCDLSYPTAKGLANHARSHLHDARGPYQCSKKCDEYYADLWMLAQHEEDCKGTGHTRPQAMHHFRIEGCSDSVPPRTIIVGRTSSSGYIPLSWINKAATARDGLPTWGARILEHYDKFRGVSTGPASIRVSTGVQTRYLPAPDVDTTHQHRDHVRWLKNRAYILTQGIIADIESANSSGITPVVLSVGVDGWACNTELIQSWLEDHTELKFKLVIHMNDVLYGMSREFVKNHRGIYWGEYNPAEILRVLKDGLGTNDSIDDLVSTWRRAQFVKDAVSGVSVDMRRNYVDFS